MCFGAGAYPQPLKQARKKYLGTWGCGEIRAELLSRWHKREQGHYLPLSMLSRMCIKFSRGSLYRWVNSISVKSKPEQRNMVAVRSLLNCGRAAYFPQFTTSCFHQNKTEITSEPGLLTSIFLVFSAFLLLGRRDTLFR